MSVDVGQKQTFPKSEIFCVFPFLHCRLFVVTVGDGHFHTFYIEKIFTFFLAYVKYTYECHRLSLPSFSGFFALFGGSLVEVGGVICKPFPKSENFSPVYSPASHSQLYSSSRCKSYGVS